MKTPRRSNPGEEGGRRLGGSSLATADPPARAVAVGEGPHPCWCVQKDSPRRAALGPAASVALGHSDADRRISLGAGGAPLRARLPPPPSARRAAPEGTREDGPPSPGPRSSRRPCVVSVNKRSESGRARAARLTQAEEARPTRHRSAEWAPRRRTRRRRSGRFGPVAASL